MATEFPDLEIHCGDCGGVGIVTSPAWAAWWDRHPGEGVFFIEDPADPAPTDQDEEVACSECRGRGRIPSDAGLAILDLVRRQLKVRGDQLI